MAPVVSCGSGFPHSRLSKLATGRTAASSAGGGALVVASVDLLRLRDLAPGAVALPLGGAAAGGAAVPLPSAIAYHKEVQRGREREDHVGRDWGGPHCLDSGTNGRLHLYLCILCRSTVICS